MCDSEGRIYVQDCKKGASDGVWRRLVSSPAIGNGTLPAKSTCSDPALVAFWPGRTEGKTGANLLPFVWCRTTGVEKL